MLTKIIVILLSLLIQTPVFGQEEFKITFQPGDMGIYLMDNDRRSFQKEYGKYFSEEGPFIYSATLNLTLDGDGNVKKVDLVEPSPNQNFNQYLAKEMRATSGMWTINGKSDSKIAYQVIIPFRFSIFPRYTTIDKKRQKMLSDGFQEYHNGLTYGTIDNCEQDTCTILDEVFLRFTESYSEATLKKSKEKNKG